MSFTELYLPLHNLKPGARRYLFLTKVQVTHNTLPEMFRQPIESQENNRTARY